MIVVRLLEPDNAKGAPMMFLVTFHAIMAAERCMIAFLRLDPAVQLLMARQAFVVCDHLADRMARRAIPNPFQPRMGRCQFPGGKLRKRCSGHHRG
jgi:hypothetical protein